MGNNVELSQGQEEGSELLGVVGKGDFDEGEVDDDLEGVEHGPDELHGGGEDEVDDEADKGGDVGDLANSFGGSPLEPSEALALLRWELGLERGLLPDQLVGFLGNEDLVGADRDREQVGVGEGGNEKRVFELQLDEEFVLGHGNGSPADHHLVRLVEVVLSFQ